MCQHCPPATLDGQTPQQQMQLGEPGLCVLCHQNQRAATIDAYDVVYYSHVCVACQDQCKAYYPCIVCRREIESGAFSDSINREPSFMCHDCRRKVAQLIEQGFTFEQIMTVPETTIIQLDDVSETQPALF